MENMPLPTENRRDKERLPKVRQRPGRTDQHPARRAGHAGLSAQRGTGAHRPGVGHLGRTGLRRGVVLFVLHDEAQRQIPDSVCMGTACYVRGGEKVLDEFRRQLGIEVGGTTPDGLFSLDSLRCVGACGLAPVVMIAPGSMDGSSDRCQRYPRRNPGPRKRDLTTRYYVK